MEKRFQKRDFSGRLRRSIRVFGSEKVYDIWPRGRLQLSSSIKEQAIAPYWVRLLDLVWVGKPWL